LNIVDPNENFVICIDACKQGLGGVLTQHGNIIYDSIKTEKHEINYMTHDFKLATIVHTLNMWGQYLMGKKFELRIDHSDLKYMFEQKTLNDSKTKWMEFLSEYVFEIKDTKWKENKLVNALIKRVHIMHAMTISIHSSNLESIIWDFVATNQHYLYVEHMLSLMSTWHKFGEATEEVRGILYGEKLVQK
jgi:hypothetical protein